MILSLLFCEFKGKCEINSVIIDYQRKENEFSIYIYCLQKDINFEKEKNRLIKLYYKHTWTMLWFEIWAAELGAAQRQKDNINKTNIVFNICF